MMIAVALVKALKMMATNLTDELDIYHQVRKNGKN